MDKNSILLQIQDILRDVLDNRDIIVSEKTIANNVEGWDSLTHIQLVVAIENYFGVKFSSREIIQIKNIGELVNIIYEKLMLIDEHGKN